MSPRTITIIVVMTAAALASWYLARSNRPADPEDVPYDTTHRGYYLKSARILGTGEDGSLLYEIEAAYAQQEARDRIEFKDVRIRYSPASTIPWVVNADEATLREGAPRISLRGFVKILNSGETSDKDIEIRTQYLELDPDQFIAETEERVQIRFGTRSVTATGMLASLNDDRIELKSNVRGKIVP